MSPATCLRSLLQWESRMLEARADVVPFLQVRPWHHLQVLTQSIQSILYFLTYFNIFFIFCKSGHSIIFNPFFIFWFYHLLYLLQVRDQHHLQPNLLAGDSWFLELFHLPRRPRPYVVTTFQPFCRPLKVQKAPQRRLLNLMDSFRRLSSRPHCWWWLLLRAVMASLMEAICLSLIRNASQSPQAAQPKHKFTETKTVAST